MNRNVINFEPEIDTLLVNSDKAYFQLSTDGGIYFLDGHCPHKGGPLQKGTYVVSENTIGCPWHRMSWKVEDLEKTALCVLATPNSNIVVTGVLLEKRQTKLKLQVK